MSCRRYIVLAASALAFGGLAAGAPLQAQMRPAPAVGMAAPGAKPVIPPGMGAPAGTPDPDAAKAKDPAGKTPPGPEANGKANGNGEPSPEDLLKPEEHLYSSVTLTPRDMAWYEPGQAGLVEAHPLVMGLAAMALATVVLLFFFLRGVKRPRREDL